MRHAEDSFSQPMVRHLELESAADYLITTSDPRPLMSTPFSTLLIGCEDNGTAIILSIQCSATWQVQAKIHTYNQPSLCLMSTPSPTQVGLITKAMPLPHLK